MKTALLYAMIVLYTAAGVYHFVHPAFYLKIMPAWLPFHKELVFVSGICEVLIAWLLIFTATRRIGAWCMIVLLILIFPANVQMMLNYLHEHNKLFWLAIVRLPFQGLLIWGLYSFTKRGTVLISAKKKLS